MEPETILRLHPNDFKTYTLKGIGVDELRAIRALLPVFRKEQTIQTDWVEVFLMTKFSPFSFIH